MSNTFPVLFYRTPSLSLDKNIYLTKKAKILKKKIISNIFQEKVSFLYLLFDK